MIKFKVDSDIDDSEVHLSLHKLPNGNVYLEADDWVLLEFDTNGKVRAIDGLEDCSCGFQIDDEGYLKIEY